MQRNEKKGLIIILAIVSMILLSGLSMIAGAQPVIPEPLKVNLWLDPIDDSGSVNNDNVTNEGLSRIFVQVDLSSLALDYDILDLDGIDAGEEGIAVEIIVNGVMTGYGSPIPGTNNSFTQYNFKPGQLSTTFIPSGGGGGLNSITAGVVYFDGADNSERIGISSPMPLTLDAMAPSTTIPDLASISDSAVPDNNRTYIKQPTFIGTSEPGASVILFANGTIVGRGMVDSQGQWEVTSAMLKRGEYAITTRVEDRAGNVSDESTPLMIKIKNTPLDRL